MHLKYVGTRVGVGFRAYAKTDFILVYECVLERRLQEELIPRVVSERRENEKRVSELFIVYPFKQ